MVNNIFQFCYCIFVTINVHLLLDDVCLFDKKLCNLHICLQINPDCIIKSGLIFGPFPAISTQLKLADFDILGDFT